MHGGKGGASDGEVRLKVFHAPRLKGARRNAGSGPPWRGQTFPSTGSRPLRAGRRHDSGADAARRRAADGAHPHAPRRNGCAGPGQHEPRGVGGPRQCPASGHRGLFQVETRATTSHPFRPAGPGRADGVVLTGGGEASRPTRWAWSMEVARTSSKNPVEKPPSDGVRTSAGAIKRPPPSRYHRRQLSAGRGRCPTCSMGWGRTACDHIYVTTPGASSEKPARRWPRRYADPRATPDLAARHNAPLRQMLGKKIWISGKIQNISIRATSYGRGCQPRRAHFRPEAVFVLQGGSGLEGGRQPAHRRLRCRSPGSKLLLPCGALAVHPSPANQVKTASTSATGSMRQIAGRFSPADATSGAAERVLIAGTGRPGWRPKERRGRASNGLPVAIAQSAGPCVNSIFLDRLMGRHRATWSPNQPPRSGLIPRGRRMSEPPCKLRPGEGGFIQGLEARIESIRRAIIHEAAGHGSFILRPTGRASTASGSNLAKAHLLFEECLLGPATLIDRGYQDTVSARMASRFKSLRAFPKPTAPMPDTRQGNGFPRPDPFEMVSAACGAARSAAAPGPMAIATLDPKEVEKRIGRPALG